MTIKQKQRQLYFLGYYGGEIDGIFGVKSKAAAKAFQKDAGLETDGIFGPKTSSASIEIIKKVQTALNALAGAGLETDGLAGELTAAAAARFQAENGLAADGQAGEKTRAALFRPVSAVPAKTGETECDFDTIKYFKRSEFACRCGKCGGYPAEMKQLVVEAADRAREHFGRACHVSSGIRCEKHNAEVGGVPGSRHLSGKAIDCRVDGVAADTLLGYVKALPNIAYAYKIDENYIHMDVK